MSHNTPVLEREREEVIDKSALAEQDKNEVASTASKDISSVAGDMQNSSFIQEAGTVENHSLPICKENEQVSVSKTDLFLPVECKKGFKHGCYLFFKRAFDIFSSGLGMILLSPIILLCLFIKWLEDFHNPVYVSTRVGKDGKLFKFYKIRSMCVGAEKMKDALIREGKNEADGPAFKMKNDPRITKFGKFLRKTSLDELLQLFNIFNGTMSVVGPRPPIPREVEEYTPYQKQRLLVKGGLLCLWQIQKNRNEISFDDWIEYDLEYIKKQSTALDLKIIFKGAYMVVFDHSGE